jgi:GNAT superfamily N-acetyltransferase
VIRTATSADLPLVRELWRAFELEIPEPDWRDDDSETDLAKLEKAVENDIVLLADDVGLAVATKTGARLGFLDILYVKPDVRRTGIATDLVREAANRLRDLGADTLELEVLHTNVLARPIYEHWGLAPVELTLAAPIDRLLGRFSRSSGPTFGAVHVQTDDIDTVSRNVDKVLPRLGRAGPSEVTGPDNGWVHVRSDTTDADPVKLHALAKELSYMSGGVTLALGVEDGAIVRYNLFDRGSSVDEYASVPEYRGALPPGDVIALGANPTVVARLTGADPHRVREIVRTAESPADLPPAQELYEEIATLMGVKA